MTPAYQPLSPLWSQIVGEDLSAVVFVRDYLQFQFNPPPTINALGKTRVATPKSTAVFGDPVFPNLAISLIGSIVEGVSMTPGEAFIISFAGGSSISVSLRPEDAVGPEAVVFYGRDQKVAVI